MDTMHTVQMACQRANENDHHNWNTMHGGENVAPGWICDYYHIQRPVYLYNILKDNFIYVFTTTYAISAHHHLSCELKSRACIWFRVGNYLVSVYLVNSARVTADYIMNKF